MVIKRIDPLGQFVKHRFFRSSCKQRLNCLVKDLAVVVDCLKQKTPNMFQNVSDPLSRVAIIDNMAESFQLQPRNGIKIIDWTGDLRDQQLFNLASFLQSVAEDNVEDLRTELSNFYKLPSTRNAAGCVVPFFKN